jgi:hypothetical protein
MELLGSSIHNSFSRRKAGTTGVVIGIFIKHLGGRTRNRGTGMYVCSCRITITTTAASAFKKYYMWSFILSRSPSGFFETTFGFKKEAKPT